jgi:hypothetical protein
VDTFGATKIGEATKTVWAMGHITEPGLVAVEMGGVSIMVEKANAEMLDMVSGVKKCGELHGYYPLVYHVS